MHRSTIMKLGVLTSLYLSQGLPFGFFTQALPVLLRKQGYSLELIGMTSLLACPWALKFLWAPWVDRTGVSAFGRRKSWIVPLQSLTFTVLLGLAFLPQPVNMTVILWAVFVVNLLAATQDIATDGLAVDMLNDDERGLGNGIQVAGYRVGMIISGGFLLIIYDTIQWAGTFGVMAVVIGLATLPVLIHKERKPRVSLVKTPSFSRIPGFFRRPGIIPIVCLIVMYKFGDAFATSMLRPFLADSGMGLTDIGWLLGTVGFVAGMVGAIAGGALVNPLGRKRALMAFAVLQGATVFGYAVVAWRGFNAPLIYFLCAVEHVASGMATAALFTCMMDWCRPESSATDYTIQASLVVLANGIASMASGFSAGALGYPAHFTVATVLTVISLIGVFVLFPTQHVCQPAGG